jgi:thiamine pyrophosphokinase
MKGVDALIASVLILIISITAIFLALQLGGPSTQKTEEILLMQEGKNTLVSIDNAVKNVLSEGEGSTRVLRFSVTGGYYKIDNATNSVTFSMESRTQIIAEGVSKIEDGINFTGKGGMVYLNLSYDSIMVTGEGEFGRGYHTLTIRNNGYNSTTQKQMIYISLTPQAPPTFLTFTDQYNQTQTLNITGKNTTSPNNLNDLGINTYNIIEGLEAGGQSNYFQDNTENITGFNTTSADYTNSLDGLNYNVTSTVGQSGGTSTNQYNQSSSANVTGNASTINQATINNYLNFNRDGNTWDVTETQIGISIINGVMVYGRQASPGMVYARTYTSPTTLGAEYTTVATVSSAIQHIKIKAAPTKDEYVTVHLKANGRLDVLRCTNGCDASADWSLIGTLTGATSSANSVRRGFDVAYEQVSGRAIVVFSDDPTTGRAYYCIWDGTSWSPSSTCGSTFTPGTANEINFGTGGVPLWIRLIERQGSNELLLGVLDSAGTYAVARWTGSSWTNILNIGTGAAVTTSQSFDLAWETNSGRGLVVFDKTSLDGTTQYRRYIPGTGWDASDTAGPDTGSGNNNWIELASDPDSNRISIIIADSEADVSIGIWKSNNVTDGFTNQLNIDTAIETTTGKDVATVWSKGNTRALFSFTDSNALTQDVRCWTTGGFSATTSDVGGSNTDDVDNIIYVGSPDNGETLALKGDIVDDLVATRWDGLGCASGNFARLPSSGTLAADLSVTTDNSAPIEFSFAYGSPLYQYQTSVEHNTTVSYSGTLNSINVSLNFTSTVNDVYNMTIYDFANSQWDASPCQNQSITANNYYTSWCNVTTNPSNYNSSTGIVRVRLNSTSDIDQGTLKEEYVQYYIGYTSVPSYANISTEHNSSTISENPLSITKINVTTLLKTNVSSGIPFRFLIYNFSSNLWEQCSQTTITNSYTKIECVKTVNPSNYISPENTIRIRLNSSGDTTTHQMMEDYLVYQITMLPEYRMEVEHNTTGVSWSGTLDSINISINFSTNVSSTSFDFLIYNFNSGGWDSCYSDLVNANTWYMWWCNKTTSLSDYLPGNVIRSRLNETSHQNLAEVKEDYVQYYVTYTQ